MMSTKVFVAVIFVATVVVPILLLGVVVSVVIVVDVMFSGPQSTPINIFYCVVFSALQSIKLCQLSYKQLKVILLYVLKLANVNRFNEVSIKISQLHGKKKSGNKCHNFVQFKIELFTFIKRINNDVDNSEISIIRKDSLAVGSSEYTENAPKILQGVQNFHICDLGDACII
uniref:Uncharacterized protein n=1 Tax=Glossina brevipalpis TaxID=37001 RepID=A0A1A9WFS7_9MUSC